MRTSNLFLSAAALLAFAAAPANAAVTLTLGSNGGSALNLTGRVSAGNLVSGSVTNQHVQPLGSSGAYIAAGPSDGKIAVLDLSGLGAINSLSFIWGSADSPVNWNVLGVYDKLGGFITSFTGAEALAFLGGPSGSTTNPKANPTVTLSFNEFASNIGSLKFSANQNAFEAANFTIVGQTREVPSVPEPATWAMLVGGLGLVGAQMRRRRTVVSFA
jgi:hypothetical protein